MGRNKKGKPKQKRKKRQPLCYLARTGRAGRIDLSARIPELSCLGNKNVTLVGLGCIGAPIALELARCGVGKLRVIEFDIVEAGTIVRWPLGLTAVGRHKTEVIEEFIRENYPYTKTTLYQHRIGEVRINDSKESELDLLESTLADSDLVIDASAELGIQYLMSDLAAEMNIPFICISTTNGNWGGRIVRIRPQTTDGCFLCYRYHEDNNSIPEPNADPNGTVQPEGCASPTFTGAGFDSGIIVYSGIRLAVSTLTENEENGYPKFSWDVAVVNLRDKSGNAIPPSWNTYDLTKHPSCHCSKTF